MFLTPKFSKQKESFSYLELIIISSAPIIRLPRQMGDGTEQPALQLVNIDLTTWSAAP